MPRHEAEMVRDAGFEPADHALGINNLQDETQIRTQDFQQPRIAAGCGRLGCLT